MFSRNLIRRFTTSAIRRSGHEGPEGIPGTNLPFSISNRYRLTAVFIAFFGSAAAIPFLVVYHHNRQR